MPSAKALSCGLAVGMSVSLVVCTFTAYAAPAPDRAKAGDFSPAQTPSEALDKFRECIRNRDYKTAAKYLDGDYREQFSKAADAATKLSEAIHALARDVDTVGLNSPGAKVVLERLQPFPRNFEYEVVRPIKDADYQMLSTLFPVELPPDEMKALGDKVAKARLKMDAGKAGDNPTKMNLSGVEEKIFLSLVPVGLKWDGWVALKESGSGKDKSWKILFPKTSDIEPKVDYLTHNYLNYVQALKKVRHVIRHDAVTKKEFEANLSKELIDAN